MASKNKPNKKKHHYKVFIIIGVILTIIVVSPVALVFGLFYDSSTSGFVADSNFNKEQEFTNMSIDSLDNVKDTHKIDFSISEYAFNNLIYSGLSSMGQELSNYVKNVTIEFKKNKYILSAEVELFNFFKTRLYINTSIEKEVNGEDANYIFKVDSIKIGRANMLNDFTKKYINQYVTDDMIKGLFSGFGFNITPDLANSRLIYPEKDITNDITSLLGTNAEGEGDSSLFSSILNEFIDRKAFEFNLEKEGYMGGTIDISSAYTNETYASIDKEEKYANDLDAFKEKAVTVLNSGAVKSENADSLFSYIVNGYTRSSDEIKSFIADKDLSSININDYTTYEGMTLPEKVDITETVKEDTKNRVDTFLTDGIICELNEDSFDGSLSNQSLVGYNFVLSRKVSESEYKINYVVVDKFYTNIIDNHLYLIVRFNINGYPNTVVIDAKVNENAEVKDFAIQFDISDIYYGNQLANEGLRNVLFDLITTSVESQDWISVSLTGEKKTMTIDLSGAIDENILKYLSYAEKRGKIYVKGNSISDNGYLQIVAEDTENTDTENG